MALGVTFIELNDCFGVDGCIIYVVKKFLLFVGVLNGVIFIGAYCLYVPLFGAADMYC